MPEELTCHPKCGVLTQLQCKACLARIPANPRKSETHVGEQSLPGRGLPPLTVTSLCTDVMNGILICCLSDTNQSDMQMAEPRAHLSARKQVTG